MEFLVWQSLVIDTTSMMFISNKLIVCQTYRTNHLWDYIETLLLCSLYPLQFKQLHVNSGYVVQKPGKTANSDTFIEQSSYLAPLIIIDAQKLGILS